MLYVDNLLTHKLVARKKMGMNTNRNEHLRDDLAVKVRPSSQSSLGPTTLISLGFCWHSSAVSLSTLLI